MNKVNLLKKTFKGLQFFILPDEKIKTMNFTGNYILCEVNNLEELFVTKSGINTKCNKSDFPLIFGTIVKSKDKDFKVGDVIIYNSCLFKFRYYIPIEYADEKLYIQVAKEDILMRKK